jgi:hypothetical protein
MAELAWPRAICRATDSAVLTGIANPAAASLLYSSVVLMITTPGLTLVTMACSPPASGEAEQPGRAPR